jgi:hypothetical protein
MARVDHYKLRGKYRTPRFRYGAKIRCLARGEAIIDGVSDAPIARPIGRRGSHKALVLCGALARAVRDESNKVVARAWGVTAQTVTKWHNVKA